MAWTDLSFEYKEMLSSTKMNQLQNNFTALAQGMTGAPRILARATQINHVANWADGMDFNTNSTDWVDRTGASTSLTITSNAILVVVDSVWTVLVGYNSTPNWYEGHMACRIVVDDGSNTYHEYLGGIGGTFYGSYQYVNGYVGGSHYLPGLQNGSIQVKVQVKVSHTNNYAYNNIYSGNPWNIFRMHLFEVGCY